MTAANMRPAFEVMGHTFHRGSVSYVGPAQQVGSYGHINFIVGGSNMYASFDTVERTEQFRTALLKELGW